MTKTQTLTRTAMGAVIIALCAWISIPAAVPFTLQTFGIFLVLAVLGARQGSVAVIVYILLGLVGLPVFSGGPGALLGPTGGYIVGFALIGPVCLPADRLPLPELARCLAGNLAGLAVCYSFGTFWFLRMSAMNGSAYSLPAVLGMCVIPFILPDCIKLALALTVGRRLARALRPVGTTC